MGLHPGVDYYVRRTIQAAKATVCGRNDCMGAAAATGSCNLSVHSTIPVSYVGNLDEFRIFCEEINRILRFSGVEYKDDGKFDPVVETRSLSEAERRARAVANKLSSRRVHAEVQKYCKAEYMEENYFHAVFEATKGLAERIREKTGLKVDGVKPSEAVL